VVMLQSGVRPDATHSDVSPAPGVPSRAERQARWREWESLVHEYMHDLTHPVFRAAAGDRAVLLEGFCELFTKEVLLAAIPIAKADADPGLRGGVEGRDANNKLFPFFTPDLVRDYTSGQYAGHVGHVENIQAQVGPTAMRAAFFQGHVELIGLRPDGSEAPAQSRSSQDLVTVPPGVHSVFALSIMTGAPEALILASNPGLKSSGPLPGRVHVPGCHYQPVVEAVERERTTGRVVDRAPESKAQIARQNGVTLDALDRANPGVNFLKLLAGQLILIPVH